MAGAPATTPTVPLSVDEAFGLARLLQRGGCASEAESLYRRLLGAAPEHVDALHFLSVLCHQSGRYADAEALISRILALYPSNADAHNNLGNVLQAQARNTEAEAAYRRAIALRPDHAAAWNNLATSCSRQGRFSEAVEAGLESVRLDPGEVDHRCNLATALRRAGRNEESAEQYREVLRREPGHPRAVNGIVRSLVAAGRREEAADVLRDCLREEPDDAVAAHQLAALTGDDVPDRAADEYVLRLFDGFAATFDAHLAKLGYRAPALVAEAAARELPEPAGDLDVLDAGCGTGLCAPLLRRYARQLVGVDLSVEMLRRAASLSVYDRLVQDELGAFLAGTEGVFDLVACADTLCYFGALDGVLAGFHRALRPGGLLVFTLEDAGDEPRPGGFRLQVHGRYVHARDYALRALEAAGFLPAAAVSEALRMESGQPVAGLVVTARKP